MTDSNHQLSDREIEILKLVATGASNKEIATQLVISVNTVKVHLRNIFSKIGVVSRTEAAMWAVQAGLVGGANPGVNADESISEVEVNKGYFLQKRNIVFIGMSVIVVILIASLVGYRLWSGRAENEEILGTTQNFEQERWTSLAEMLSPRDDFASSVASNKIYVMGGETDTGITSSVNYYDIETNQWISVTDMPLAVTDIQAATIGGKIYVPGGRFEDDRLSSELLIFDPGEDLWQTASPLPVSLSSYALTSFEGKLYLFGGWDGTGFVNLVFEYDPTLDTWKEKTSMTPPRGWSGAAVSGGKIHVVGGYNGEQSLDIHEVYSPEQDNPGENPWNIMTPLPVGLSRFGIISVAEIIHIIGGSDSDDGVFHAFRYTPQNDQWQNFSTPFENEWTDMGGVGMGDKIYLFGGQLENQLNRQLISYQAVYFIMIPILQ